MIRGTLGEGESLKLHLQNILALQEVYLGEEAPRFSGLSVKHLTDIKGVVVVALPCSLGLQKRTFKSLFSRSLTSVSSGSSNWGGVEVYGRSSIPVC